MKTYPLLIAWPELQRNLWLELSTARLIFMPIVLGLIFAAGYEVNELRGLTVAVQAAFGVLTIIWGTRLAADSFSDEIQDRTWDMQRLSASSATSLILGKLLGGTVYAWYGAFFCIIVDIIALPDTISVLPMAILTALLGQAASLFMAILLSQLQTRRSAQTAVAQLFGIIVTINLVPYGLLLIGQGTSNAASDSITWYGVSFSSYNFLLTITALFMMWLVIGSIRLVRGQLGFRDGPLMWLAFTVFILALACGFNMPHWSELGTYGIACTITGILLYLGLFSQQISLINAKKLVHVIRKQKLKAIWRELPMWVVSLVAFETAWILLAGKSSAFYYKSSPSFAVFLAVTGFVVRDIILIHACRLRYPRRSGSLLLLLFFLIYILGPVVTLAGWQGWNENHFNPDFKLPFSEQFFLPGNRGAFWISWGEALIVALIFRSTFLPIFRKDEMPPSLPANDFVTTEAAK